MCVFVCMCVCYILITYCTNAWVQTIKPYDNTVLYRVIY